MVREFEIPLSDANLEDAQFRLDNERDENGQPIPHREWTTGIDRTGSAARMAVKGRMPLVAHGFDAPAPPGSKTPATPLTLVVFAWSTERLRLDRRFREVTLEVSFAAHGSRRDAEPEARRLREKGVGRQYWDPEVLAVAPEGTAWYHRTTHKVVEKDGVDFSVNFTFGGVVAVGPRVYWERGDAMNRTDAIQLSGSMAMVGPGHTRPNAVRSAEAAAKG
ncbi:hypothetical protein F5144DRAFT_613276 [Chaetomium tenue]|uniref:Uncharacterized protein n=1 Tax=Chaetomium tenue TaxID=1854479 RepID=A0ACB7P3A5_9PEZI|nr:hypothetical protein F5144DRAFT_613276 [Chaetomium globosum]